MGRLVIDYFQQNGSSSLRVPRKESIDFGPETCCETRQGIFNYILSEMGLNNFNKK